jgi:hypothetical protein
MSDTETGRSRELLSYSVKFVCGFQEPDDRCKPVVAGYYATEINIHNYHDREVEIRKRILPVVCGGEPVGREPEYVGIRAEDEIVLPPDSATMDDCCHIALLLYGFVPTPMPLTIGYLEIVSNEELAIDAVYTVVGINRRSPSIDVERVEARKKH